MHWTVLAPFNRTYTNSDWLTPHMPDNHHEFLYIPRPGVEVSWHQKKVPVTTSNEWLDFWRQTSQAMRERQGGILTVFPQLAAMAGLRKQLQRGDFPLVAWWFNTHTYAGLKGAFARASLQAVDKFIIHNRCEAEYYSQWLGIPKQRFEFVPLQTTGFPRTYSENLEHPFIYATGSGRRDYRTFFAAIEKLNLPAIVTPGRHAVEGLTIPSQAELRFTVTQDDLRHLPEQARVHVIPMNTEGPVGGTITIVDSMRRGDVIIATRRSGVDDYITDGETGILVEPYSVDAMAEAIDRVWNDPELRQRLSQAAYQYAADNYSDAAGAANVVRVLNSFDPPPAIEAHSKKVLQYS